MTEWQWQPAFDPLALAVAAGLAALAAVVLVATSRNVRRPLPRVATLVLRLAVIGLLVLLLANPVVRREVPAPDRSWSNLILFDTSESMALPAEGGSAGSEGQSRLDAGRAWLEAVLARTAIPVSLLGFDAAVRPIDSPATLEAGGGATHFAAAVERALELNADRDVANLLVVSDGRIHDRGDLDRALEAAHERAIPVHTHAVGAESPPRNAFIRDGEAPRVSRANTVVRVRAVVGGSGLEPAESLTLELRDAAGATLAAREIRAEDTDREQEFEFTTGLRTESYSLVLADVGGEVTLDDNAFPFTIEVTNPKIRVLFMEGTHNGSYYAGRPLAHAKIQALAWESTGDMEVDILMPQNQYARGKNLFRVAGFGAHGGPVFDTSRGYPRSREELYAYDVVICSDVQKANFDPEQMEWTVDFVTEHGGGFCMIGGNTAFDTGEYDKTPWEKIIPVDMTEYGFGHQWRQVGIVFPESAQRHPILRILEDPEANAAALASHPPFGGFHDIRRPKPGATVLAVRDDTGGPLVVVQSYGKGRSMAFLSDSNGGWGGHIMSGWGSGGGGFGGFDGRSGFFPQQATEVDPGGKPPNDYYNTFWANSVRWLAENSVNLQQRKLIGRAEAASIRPGESVAVSAKLYDTDPATLDREDVGARLDLPGSPRTRLRFDRVRAEFVGTLDLPDELDEGEVRVLFDAPAAARTDAVPLRVIQLGRELENPLPDRTLMADIAATTGGAAVETVDEAVEALARLPETAVEATAVAVVPAWATPWLWALALALLVAEWLVRRMLAT